MAAAPRALVVRTSLIYSGQVPGPQERLVLDALDGRRDIAFFVDGLRSPVPADDLAAALLEPAGLDICGRLHAVGPDAAPRYQFARLIALSKGRDPAALRSASSDGLMPARSRNCALDCSLAAGLLASPIRDARSLLGAGVTAAAESLH